MRPRANVPSSELTDRELPALVALPRRYRRRLQLLAHNLRLQRRQLDEPGGQRRGHPGIGRCGQHLDGLE